MVDPCRYIPGQAVATARLSSNCSLEPMSTDSIRQLNDANFDTEVLRDDSACVVQFWAPWSSVSRRSAAGFETIAEEFDPRVRSLRVNVDDNPQTASNYSVINLPTFILFRGGRVVARLDGSASPGRLRALFEQS
jgi:thioredoxin 1